MMMHHWRSKNSWRSVATVHHSAACNWSLVISLLQWSLRQFKVKLSVVKTKGNDADSWEKPIKNIDALLEALVFSVWISISDNQPLLMHSRLRLLLFSPTYPSIGPSLTTLLSFFSFSPSLSLRLLVFLYLMKRASFLFFRFSGCFSEFLPFPRPVWEVGSPTLRGPSSSCLLSCEFKH